MEKRKHNFKFTFPSPGMDALRRCVYDYCVTDLDTTAKYWTDSLAIAKAAAASCSIAQVWDTNENQEVK